MNKCIDHINEKNVNSVESLIPINKKKNFFYTPKDYDAIQPRVNQVWNIDEIDFDRNGKWSKFV